VLRGAIHLLAELIDETVRGLCHKRLSSFAQKVLKKGGLIEASPPRRRHRMVLTYVWTCLCARGSSNDFFHSPCATPGMARTSGMFTWLRRPPRAAGQGGPGRTEPSPPETPASATRPPEDVRAAGEDRTGTAGDADATPRNPASGTGRRGEEARRGSDGRRRDAGDPDPPAEGDARREDDPGPRAAPTERAGRPRSGQELWEEERRSGAADRAAPPERADSPPPREEETGEPRP